MYVYHFVLLILERKTIYKFKIELIFPNNFFLIENKFIFQHCYLQDWSPSLDSYTVFSF